MEKVQNSVANAENKFASEERNEMTAKIQHLPFHPLRGQAVVSAP